MLKGKTVVLGVTGSIAAYKMANVASMLVKLHADDGKCLPVYYACYL